jgi:non-specific serine/threonine protein kinase
MGDGRMANISEPMVEPLTRRELEILELLVDNLSNTQIADKLTLATSSVKWYVKQIYAKLGISERGQIISRVNELGLLRKDLPAPPAKHNLPASMTPFIGRKSQVEQVKRMLTDPNCRIITLTGAGGVGKTRLALKVAEGSLNVFKHGVWLIELASVNDPGLVDQTVASVFGLRGGDDRPSRAVLEDYLSERSLLLILDNCEQLIEAVAHLANTLLRHCPRLKILVTSREALGVEGEIPFSVPSLTFPDPRHLPAIESLVQYEAVHLFVERTRSSIPDFAITETNALDIARICKRLDGIPLALELAAARVKVLGVEEIANRLEESFQLLTGGFRTALPRHQTMHASINWSYQLLSDAERILLRRFSVFSGGWTVEAAEEICSDGAVPASNVIDLLIQLVNKSLVTVENETGHGVRYYLLDAIWDYAQEKLSEAGERQRLYNCHLDYFLKLGETAEPNLHGREQVTWLNRLRQELPNFRFALDWGLKADPEAELKLAAALMLFWHIRGRWSEGLDWLSKGLASETLQEDHKPTKNQQPEAFHNPLTRAKALAAAGFLRLKSLEYHDAEALLEESLKYYRKTEIDDDSGKAFTLLELAKCANALGDYAHANAYANESQALYRAKGFQFGISESLLVLGNNESDPIQAKQLFLNGLDIKREIGDINGLAHTLQLLAEITVYETDFDRAIAWLLESLDYYEKVGNKKATVNVLNSLSWIAWITGNYAQAIQEIDEALSISQEIEEKNLYATNLLLRSDIKLSQGLYEDCSVDIQEALKIGQEMGDKVIIASAQVKQGKMAWIQDRDDHASKILEEALYLAQGIGSKNIMAFSLYYLGRVAAEQNDPGLAESYYKQSIQLFYEMNFWYWDYIAYSLEALAKSALARQRPEMTARLYGAASHLFRMLVNTLSPLERDWREDDLKSARTALGEELYNHLWQEGYILTTEKAIEIV